MALKDILVFLDEGTPSEGRLKLATNLAQVHQASLTAVFLQDDRGARPQHGLAQPWLGVVAGPPISGAVDTTPSATASELAEEWFRDRLRSAQVKGDWYSLEPDTAELTLLARTADLAIIGQINPDVRPAPTWRPDEIVVGCARPVLMVPYVGNYTHIGRRVLVAWDGSREAVRALNDALPLISGAEAVTVMTVRGRPRDSGHGEISTERVIRHLTRHGIAAHPAEAFGAPVSDVLLSRAADLAADLLVAGAYHHAQLRETLFGGVSRELFQHMTLPVLMSH